MKNFLLIKIIFILLIFPNYTFGKGLPPGTGSNDVPANLLILLTLRFIKYYKMIA